MASSSSSTAVKKLEQQLTCAVCLDRYTQPRTLPCLHSFCHDCLASLPIEQQQADQLIKCPVCRESFQLPHNGVAGLQPAFLINSFIEIHELLQKVSDPQQQTECENCQKQPATGYCKQCCKFLCHSCVDRHNGWAEFKNHCFVSMQDVIESATSLVPLKQSPLQHCSKHDKPLEVHCSTCDQLICHLCKDSMLHGSHEYESIDDAFKKQEKIVKKSLVAVEEKLASLSKVGKSLESQEKEMLVQGKAMKNEIHTRVQQLIQLLKESERNLNSDVDTVIHSYLEKICTQKSEVSSLYTQLKSCEEFTKEELRIGSQQEIVLMRRQMVERMDSLCSLVEDRHIQQAKEIKFRFAPSIEAFTPYSIGSVIQFSDFDASVKNKLSFTAHDALLNIPIASSSISCQLSPFADSTVAVKCDLRHVIEDMFDLTYCPSSPGLHLMSMQIDGSDIESPFNSIIVPSRQPELIFSRSCPVGVAISQRGNIIVVDNKGNCISILDPTNGAVLRKYALKRFNFLLPFGVAVTSNGDIVVADQFSHQILLLRSDGMLRSSIGSEGAGSLKFRYPMCIAVHSNGKIFITDCINNRVQVLNPDLSYSHSFGKKGNQPSEFNTPFGIAIDSEGSVYVADSRNSRIQKFTPEGQLLAVFGNERDSTPTGLCVDDNDVLYVTDSFKNTVSLYSTRGQLLGYVGRSDGSSFSIPQDVAVDNTGRVFVSHKDGLVMYTY